MPLPKRLTTFNRLISNKVTRPFAAHLPWFAVLHHTGRVSGKTYATPIMAWKAASTVVVALTYGSDLDWLKNASASESRMTIGGETFVVGHPEPIAAPEGLKRVPAIVRRALELLKVDEFVEFPVL